MSEVSGPPDPRLMNQQLMSRLLSKPAPPIPRDGYGLRVLEVRGRWDDQLGLAHSLLELPHFKASRFRARTPALDLALLG